MTELRILVLLCKCFIPVNTWCSFLQWCRSKDFRNSILDKIRLHCHCSVFHHGSVLLTRIKLNSGADNEIHPLCMKYGRNLLIYSKTTTVQPLKFLEFTIYSGRIYFSTQWSMSVQISIHRHKYIWKENINISKVPSIWNIYQNV